MATPELAARPSAASNICRPLAVAGLVGIAATLAHRFLSTWGSAPSERERPLPSDALIDPCDAQADFAMTINAPFEKVWPYLTQIGQDRGGFYSYEKLENLIGCEITGTTVLHDEWASRQVGQKVHLTPTIALSVAEVEPGRSLVFYGGDKPGGKADSWDLPLAFSWAFVLTDEGGETRLHVRERYRFNSLGGRLLGSVIPLGSSVMSEKMLRTIRGLAEA